MEIKNLKVEELISTKFKIFGNIISPNYSEPVVINELFNLWNCIDEMEIKDGNWQICWLSTKFPRGLLCDKLEMHNKCAEYFIPVNSEAIYIVALLKEDCSPDLDSLYAFYLRGGEGISVNPGVFHWIPFPVDKDSSFILISRKETAMDDLIIFDLKKKLDLKIKLIL